MKQYQTKEECIKEKGEHAWHEVKKDSMLGCAVYHADGYCSWNDPTEQCYHCPAKRSYTRTQPAIFEWIES